MAGRACARLRLPPALATAIDSGRSDLSVTFDNEGMTIKLGDAAYAFRAAPDNAAISELYEYTDETDADGFTEDRELAATGSLRYLAAVAPTAKDRATTKARTVDAATKAKSRQTTVIDRAPPAKRRAVAKKKTKKAPVSRPVLCAEADVEDADTEAARLFGEGALVFYTPQIVEVFDDVKEVGVLYQKDAVDVYVIFASEAAARAADANEGFRTRPCAVEDLRTRGAPVFRASYDAARVTRNDEGERRHVPSRAEACKAAGFDAGNVKLETLAAQVLEHVRPAARRYLGEYDDDDEEAAHDALERAAHDLEVLASSDPLAAGIQRYRDLQLAASTSSADADSDRLLAQNRRVEPAWDSVRCALGVVRRCLRKALVALREAQRSKLPASLDGPPVDCRLLRGALFFPPSIERLA
ncbi:unnamed protein product [Pelagomonas calceolata]|uniref:Uncharacterized protein n=1 Tax=Pelagomonas calceolata TaxID=35677 RepID=A0A7S4A5W7_9STRA|nr:unnamed protein product [Pelagomonas calceolata]